MNYNLSRRSFLGASLLAIPGIRAVAALAPIRDSEFVLKIVGWPHIGITTFLDGAIKATFNGHELQSTEENYGTRLSGTSDGIVVELKVRRPGRQVLDVEWIRMYAPKESFVIDGGNPVYSSFGMLT